MKATFGDWLQLLGIDDAIDGLLAGSVSLTVAQSRASSVRDTWPSVSQDYIAVLDQLEPFFGDVAGVIDEQREIVDRFNAVMGEFGLGIDPPSDRLLTEADVEEMREQSQQLADVFRAIRGAMQLLEEEIEDLSNQLDDLLSSMEEGDPFAEEDIADLAQDLQELVDAMEAEGCLPE